MLIATIPQIMEMNVSTNSEHPIVIVPTRIPFDIAIFSLGLKDSQMMKDSLVSAELCLRPPVVLSICIRSEIHCDAYPFQDSYSNFKAASRQAIG